MGKSKDGYMEYYNRYFEKCKTGFSDPENWKKFRVIFYSKFDELNELIVRHLWDLQSDIEDSFVKSENSENDVEYKILWIKQCERSIREINELLLKRKHVENPGEFERKAITIIENLYNAKTSGMFEFVENAANQIRNMADIGDNMNQIQKRIEALTILIRDIEQERWWWTKPHKTDVANLFMNIQGKGGTQAAYNEVEHILKKLNLKLSDYHFKGDVNGTYRTMLNNANK